MPSCCLVAAVEHWCKMPMPRTRLMAQMPGTKKWDVSAPLRRGCVRACVSEVLSEWAAALAGAARALAHLTWSAPLVVHAIQPPPGTLMGLFAALCASATTLPGTRAPVPSSHASVPMTHAERSASPPCCALANQYTVDKQVEK